MAASAVAGRKAKLKVDNGGGGGLQNVGGLVDVTMNVNVDELECTSHDSAGAREYLPNHHDVTMDVAARWLDGDPGQDIILNAVFAKTTFTFEFTMEEGVSGKKKYTGTAFATAANPSGPLDDTGSLDVTLRCSSVVQGTQA